MKETTNQKNFPKLTLINTILILILIGIVFFRESNFSWENWLRYEISRLPFLSVKIPTQLVEDEILRFAVIGDSHIGAENSNPIFLKDALQKAKEQKANFVVLIGDITENGKLEELKEAKKILDESGVKYFTVPGNHDFWSGGMGNYEKIFGKRYQKIEIPLENIPGSPIKTANLFLIDNGAYVESDRLGDIEQMKWLEEEMYKKEKRNDELVLVFQQTPLVKVPNLEQNYLRMYFCKQGVDGLFSADIHRTERYYSDCNCPVGLAEGYDLIPTFIVGSIFKTKEFPGFILMHYFKNRKFEAERILLDKHIEQLTW